jgi:hypothetical protein
MAGAALAPWQRPEANKRTCQLENGPRRLAPGSPAPAPQCGPFLGLSGLLPSSDFLQGPRRTARAPGLCCSGTARASTCTHAAHAVRDPWCSRALSLSRPRVRAGACHTCPPPPLPPLLRLAAAMLGGSKACGLLATAMRACCGRAGWPRPAPCSPSAEPGRALFAVLRRPISEAVGGRHRRPCARCSSSGAIHILCVAARSTHPMRGLACRTHPICGAAWKALCAAWAGACA